MAVTIGDVTWSSMMSGLRSQRVYTITCVSLRSGMASSGMVRIDHNPARQATAVSVNTTRRLFAENSMILAIMPVPLRCARFSLEILRWIGFEVLPARLGAEVVSLALMLNLV